MRVVDTVDIIGNAPGTIVKATVSLGIGPSTPPRLQHRVPQQRIGSGQHLDDPHATPGLAVALIKQGENPSAFTQGADPDRAQNGNRISLPQQLPREQTVPEKISPVVLSRQRVLFCMFMQKVSFCRQFGKLAGQHPCGQHVSPRRQQRFVLGH